MQAQSGFVCAMIYMDPKIVIEQFSKKHVLVVGDAILDTYVNGSIDRICREAPVPIFNTLTQTHQCGGASNTAINLAALGAETHYLTVTGKDTTARQLMACLSNASVHTDNIVQDSARITLSKKRITASSSILLRIDEGTTDSVSAAACKELVKRFTALYKQVDAVVLSDYGYGTLTDEFLEAIGKTVRGERKPLVVDAKDLRRFAALRPTAVKPNYEEALAMLNMPLDVGAARVARIQLCGKILHAATGADKVTVTLDKDGVLYFEKGKKPCHLPCAAREPKMTIGAGDTFVSALTLALACNAPGRVATEIAAGAAAVVVQKD